MGISGTRRLPTFRSLVRFGRKAYRHVYIICRKAHHVNIDYCMLEVNISFWVNPTIFCSPNKTQLVLPLITTQRSPPPHGVGRASTNCRAGPSWPFASKSSSCLVLVPWKWLGTAKVGDECQKLVVCEGILWMKSWVKPQGRCLMGFCDHVLGAF